MPRPKKVIHTKGIGYYANREYTRNMRKQVTTLQQNPGRVYKLMDFKTLKLLPWAKDERTVRKILEQDKKGANILHAKITGAGTKRRYLVVGKNIINYLQIYGPALMNTVRKAKTYGNKTREKRESGNRGSSKKSRS